MLFGTQHNWEDKINPLAPNDECAALQGGGLNFLTTQHIHQPTLAFLVQTHWDFFFPFAFFSFFLSFSLSLSFSFFLLCLFACVCVGVGGGCMESLHKILKSSNLNLSILKIEPGVNSGTKQLKFV